MHTVTDLQITSPFIKPYDLIQDFQQHYSSLKLANLLHQQMRLECFIHGFEQVDSLIAVVLFSFGKYSPLLVPLQY